MIAKLYIGVTIGFDSEIVGFEQLVMDVFGGFTLYHITGGWKGEIEPAVVYEIVTNKDRVLVLEIAKIAKTLFNQQAVLVTFTEATSELVE